MKTCKICPAKHKALGYCRYHYLQLPERLAYRKKWRKDNAEKLQKQGKEYREKNKEYIKKYGLEYYKKNKDKINEYNRKYRKTSNKHNEYNKNYNKTHPEITLKASKNFLEKYGKTFNMKAIEYSYALISWGRMVKKRDRQKCQICGEVDCLNAHHILHKAKYPQLSLNVNNGITLCKKCHNECHGIKPRQSFSLIVA